MVLSGPVAVCVDRPLLSLDRPFTYLLPEDLGAEIGSLVQVPFHGKLIKGWVLGPTDDVPGRILSVKKLVSPVSFFDERMLTLLRWVSERYVAPLATVIGRSYPPRVVAEEEGRAVAPPERVAASRDEVPAPLPPAPSALSGYRRGSSLLAALEDSSGAFVLRPAPEDEVGTAVETVGACLTAGRSAIVIVPEAEPVPATARAVVEAFGERVGLFLGGSRRSRYRMWLDIKDGRYDVVVGTRPAVFSPLRDLGLVFVSRESHPAHREDRVPYYHVRDVALARAEIDGAPCVLSALCPSCEAAALGLPEVTPRGRRWPPVEVVRPGPEGRAPRLVAALREARRAFLYQPLPGYGVAQVCRSCGEPAACAVCGGLLRAEGGRVACAVCGVEGLCAACGSGTFGIRRGGAERVEEWAGRLTDLPVGRVGPGDPPPDLGRPGILVGGAEAVRDVGPVGLDLVAILDADLAARRPGLVAVERSLATWMEAASMAAPSGRVIVQTARPNDPAVQALVRGNPERFHRAELARRAEAGFPAGAAVFRVAGAGSIVEELEALEPRTLLVSGPESERVCLLALDRERVQGFGRRMRELAEEAPVIRVEAEPHL